MVSTFEVVSEGSAISRRVTGSESTPRPRITAASMSAGTFCTSVTQRRPMVMPLRKRFGQVPSRFLLPATPGMRAPKAFSPKIPSSAGTRVRATSIATATVSAASRPIQDRNSMPATTRAASAMITVAAAKTTAEPAVPTAMPAASGAGMRSRSTR